MTVRERVTWVLGTGFSQPLGGPQLKDLLSVNIFEETEASYRAPPRIAATEDVTLFHLYHHGRRYAGCNRHFLQLRQVIPGDGEDIWPDAEAFLSYLEAANAGSEGPANRLKKIVEQIGGGQTQLSTLLSLAKRHVAVECCAFLKDANLESERWLPYLSWANDLLRGGDAVITFNYDCVLEKLIRFRESVAPTIPLAVVLDSDEISNAHWNRRNKTPCVLKLHGSTSWKALTTDGGKVKYESTHDDEFAIKDPGRAPAILTPGIGKFAGASRDLKPLWDRAAEALREASHVVFMGYRFPESDAAAKETLLGAIAENEQNDLDLHIVLGPGENDHTLRLRELLRRAASSGRTDLSVPERRLVPTSAKTVRIHKYDLYTQDFMSVWTRDQFRHWREPAIQPLPPDEQLALDGDQGGA